MTQTKLMRADDLAHTFNSTEERGYWTAQVAGTRERPVVNFNSRSSMVRLSYVVDTQTFTIAFNKAAAAFGDFTGSAYRSLAQVAAVFKAAGLPFEVPIASPVLRIEYDPETKVATVTLAKMGDDWAEAEPMPFKEPARNNSNEGLDL